ncbi:MAG: transposase, partial [Gammaproteobacteria bacterium]|nr:transposase [Gammaproteobacteria bacterium]
MMRRVDKRSSASTNLTTDIVGNPHNDNPKGLEFRLKDYLALVDWTARAIRNDKRGGISAELPPILQRLQIKPKAWLQMTT